MSGWDDLVTTALLGTGRRSLPGSLPPAVGRLAAGPTEAGTSVLDAAAGYVSYLVAGARPAPCPEPDPAPRQVVDLAPEPAQALLRRLLDAGDARLVDAWLAECGERGLGVRAGLWTVLATAATAATGPDRSLVRTALGQRGLAFLRLNPAWRPVLRPTRLDRPADRVPSGATGPAWSPAATRTALDAVRVTRTSGRRQVRVDPAAADLQRAVADADLDAWHRHTGLRPGPLLDLLRSSDDHHAVLTAGLAEATVRQRHPEWASALAGSGHVTSELLALVPPTQHDPLVRAWSGGGQDPGRLAQWLALLPGAWSAAVTEAALRLLVDARVDTRAARRLGHALAHRAPLSAHTRVRQLVERSAPAATAALPWSRAAPPSGLVEADRVLGLRVEIRQAFSATAPTEETP